MPAADDGRARALRTHCRTVIRLFPVHWIFLEISVTVFAFSRLCGSNRANKDTTAHPTTVVVRNVAAEVGISGNGSVWDCHTTSTAAGSKPIIIPRTILPIR